MAGGGFGGYVHADDVGRLTSQLERTRMALSNGRWWALSALREVVGGSDASVSARIRDLRKPQFGARRIVSRRLRNGVWQYRDESPDALSIHVAGASA